jgi:hypothetical protein
MQSHALSIELWISLFPLSLNVLVYAHVNVGVFTRTPFLPYPVWCHLTLQRMDGATEGMPGCISQAQR